MHWPGPDTADWAGSPEALASACSFEWFRQHVQQAWANMLRLKEVSRSTVFLCAQAFCSAIPRTQPSACSSSQEGLSLRVGVSNFYRAHLSELSRQVTPALFFSPQRPSKVRQSQHFHAESFSRKPAFRMMRCAARNQTHHTSFSVHFVPGKRFFALDIAAY
eukprot:1765435-Rhodomonas_salina.6